MLHGVHLTQKPLPTQTLLYSPRQPAMSLPNNPELQRSVCTLCLGQGRPAGSVVSRQRQTRCAPRPAGWAMNGHLLLGAELLAGSGQGLGH